MVAEQKPKRDWLAMAAAGAGVAAAATGLYLYTRGPKGATPGGDVRAVFKFSYNGSGGAYVFQVSFGNKIFDTPIFDHVDGLTFSKVVTLTEPKAYEVELVMTLPMGTTPNVYDAEALIRLPTQEQFQSLIRLVTENALEVVKS